MDDTENTDLTTADLVALFKTRVDMIYEQMTREMDELKRKFIKD